MTAAWYQWIGATSQSLKGMAGHPAMQIALTALAIGTPQQAVRCSVKIRPSSQEGKTATMPEGAVT